MADLTADKVTSAGLVATLHNAASGGDTFPFGAVVRVSNGGESEVTVTVVTPVTVDGLAVDDRDIPVAAGTAVYIRPTVAYRDAETKTVQLLYSDVTGVTVEVIN